MILEKLILKNFRQFRGEQEIVFSNLKAKNVTLVHAENGFGKTALLNALLWCLYGHEGLTPDLAKKESIIHEGVAARAANPEDAEASVTLLFSHKTEDDTEKYTLTRSLTLAQQRVDSTKTSVSLEVLRNGETFPERLAQAKIQSIVPDGISSLLFFNGERIEHLAMEDSAERVADAIQQMLGLKLLRTAIEDLSHQNVRGKLRTELKECTSDEKAALIEQQEQIDQKITDQTNKKALAQKNLEATDGEIAVVNASLDKNRAAHELQTQRTQLEQQKTQLSDRLQGLTKKLGQLIAEDGYTLFAGDLVKRGKEIVQQLRSEGKIPAKVLNSFLEDLLAQHKCICTRHLEDGSEERKAVEALLTIAGDQHFNNAVGALDNAIGVIESLIQRTQQSLQETNRDRLKIKEDLTVIENTIEAIHQKLGAKDDEEVHKLEQRRDALRIQHDQYVGDVARAESKLQELAQERECNLREIQRLKDNEAGAQRAQRRLDTVEASIALLEKMLRYETEDLRPVLNQEIDQHFRKIIDRGYWVELSPDFKLTIKKTLDLEGVEGTALERDVALSTGQRQILSLVFVASLVALARKRADIPTILKGLSGAEYPMVMDSPFGQLGVMFREGVAKWVPDLAPQVVIFVSSTQYEGAVAKVLRQSNRIGKRYYLCYHGPRLQKEARPDLSIDGQKFEQYAESKEEFTEICEIE
jgi:DNA sulfur modification protein DndD